MICFIENMNENIFIKFSEKFFHISEEDIIERFMALVILILFIRQKI